MMWKYDIIIHWILFEMKFTLTFYKVDALLSADSVFLTVLAQKPILAPVAQKW